MGLIVDLFAGGGGASLGIEMATGRSPDIAVNHDADAIRMHAVNHPATRHLQRNVWHVDPLDYVRNQEVDLLWASPDCKHHSKAKGARPVKRNIRDLAWVVVLWAKRARPKVIALENVEEFRDWGPVVPDDKGDFYPCPDRKGQTFKKFVGELRRLGYRVQWRELVAADYGAPTIRKRLYLIARRDGLPITWPEKTHSAPKKLIEQGYGPADHPDYQPVPIAPWRTAANIIDWSLPCPSIFDTSEEIKAQYGIRANRPLAPATMRRIAKGVVKYVLDAVEPFIVPITHTGSDRVEPIGEPLRTTTTAHRGERALVMPFVSRQFGASVGHGFEAPSGRLVGANKSALVAAFMAQHNTGVVGRPADAPVSTITATGAQQTVVAASLSHFYSSNKAGGEGDLSEPMRTVTAGGRHAGLIAAFLSTYYGTDQAPEMQKPLPTVTTKDRHSLVTVSIAGETYVIVDIGMRMLSPRELFRAQGFPDSYEIDVDAAGRPFTKTAQVEKCGNSVCPPVAAAIVAANLPWLARREVAA